MSNEVDKEPNFFDVDLEQWHRDINTFAAATTSALDAIIDELSNVCSGRPGHSVSKTNQIRKKTKLSQITEQLAKEVEAKNPTAAPITTSSSPVSGVSRLASLKEKLARRVSKS